MLKKIKVYGTLKKFLGQAEFEVDLNTPKEALSFFKELDYSDRKNLERYCPGLYFQLFMLQLIVNNDINQVPKEGAFSLGKIAEYPLSDIHIKFFKMKMDEFTKKNKCGYPMKTTSIDY